MKRLFYVRDTASNTKMKHNSDGNYYFDKKMQAKDYRNYLNGKDSKRYVIALGPDHRRYNG